jgi:hypothetical protein
MLIWLEDVQNYSQELKVKRWEQTANNNREEWALAINKTKVLGGFYCQELIKVPISEVMHNVSNLYIYIYTHYILQNNISVLLSAYL